MVILKCGAYFGFYHLNLLSSDSHLVDYIPVLCSESQTQI